MLAIPTNECIMSVSFPDGCWLILLQCHFLTTSHHVFSIPSRLAVRIRLLRVDSLYVCVPACVCAGYWFPFSSEGISAVLLALIADSMPLTTICLQTFMDQGGAVREKVSVFLSMKSLMLSLSFWRVISCYLHDLCICIGSPEMVFCSVHYENDTWICHSS